MLARKDKVVTDLTKGVEFLFKKNKVAYVKGTARIVGRRQDRRQPTAAASRSLEAKNIVIATGSEVMPLPGVEIDEKQIVSSTGALTLAKVPGHLVVVGGGYIGLEMGSVWRRLGAKVTVVEFLDRIVPGMDGEIAKQFQRVLTKQGMTFRLGTKVTAAKKAKAGVTLTLEPAAGGKAETLEADVVLVAIGRRPYTERPRPGDRRRRRRQQGPHHHRRAFPHQRAGHLRHRRRHRRADAGPQGGGGRAWRLPRSSPGRPAM